MNEITKNANKLVDFEQKLNEKQRKELMRKINLVQQNMKWLAEDSRRVSVSRLIRKGLIISEYV